MSLNPSHDNIKPIQKDPGAKGFSPAMPASTTKPVPQASAEISGKPGATEEEPIAQNAKAPVDPEVAANVSAAQIFDAVINATEKSVAGTGPDQYESGAEMRNLIAGLIPPKIESNVTDASLLPENTHGKKHHGKPRTEPTRGQSTREPASTALPQAQASERADETGNVPLAPTEPRSHPKPSELRALGDPRIVPMDAAPHQSADPTSAHKPGNISPAGPLGSGPQIVVPPYSPIPVPLREPSAKGFSGTKLDEMSRIPLIIAGVICVIMGSFFIFDSETSLGGTLMAIGMLLSLVSTLRGWSKRLRR